MEIALDRDGDRGQAIGRRDRVVDRRTGECEVLGIRIADGQGMRSVSKSEDLEEVAQDSSPGGVVVERRLHRVDLAIEGETTRTGAGTGGHSDTNAGAAEADGDGGPLGSRIIEGRAGARAPGSGVSDGGVNWADAGRGGGLGGADRRQGDQPDQYGD